jgi:hypothetical protein
MGRTFFAGLSNMPLKDEAAAWSAIGVIFAMLFLAIGYVFLTISINAGRTSEYLNIQAQIQEKVSEIAKGPTAFTPEQLQTQLLDLFKEQDKKSGEMARGNGAELGFVVCLLPLNPGCFHRNSSEQNNMWLAVASGALGAILFLLRALRAGTTSEPSASQNAVDIITVICLIPTGMIIGLLTLFFLRGTKGALLTPLADVVQVENPYGIAFACTMAALFSDRIFAWLSKLIDVLPSPPPR